MDKRYLQKLFNRFLDEDIGSGDITSESIFSDTQEATAEFIAKSTFVCVGMNSVAALVFQTQNPLIRITNAVDDGLTANPGDKLLEINGPVLDLLKAERVALNIVQRLCGIATLTQKMVQLCQPSKVKITDTRKTTPGLKILEKYAVRAGGGANHRFNLADGVLIKDNHIAACGSIKKAVSMVRENIPHTLKIEVETETIKDVEACLNSNVDIIMLDNMPLKTIRKAVDLAKGKALLEVSGGITVKNIKEVSQTGIDLISVGALTHSAEASDISMKITIND
jgi:nicotinate-nucleotide pyrophosphorylase (carboxylating)